jgi:predicted esterase YcpF (UPF0227 family)
VIVYLHGFNSASSSHKARATAAYLQNLGRGDSFICPDLPYDPDQAIAAVEALPAVQEPSRLTFVGSSLGGFYATWLAEKFGCRAVLLQPAVFPHIGLEKYLGLQKNLYTGAEYELTRTHLAALRQLYVEKVDPERYLLILETGDEVLDYREAVRKYEGARMVMREGGDHMLQSFTEHLPRLIAFAGLNS